MSKHCETFDHTADVGLAAEADTLPELFEALAEGLAEIICPRGKVVPAQARAVRVRAEDIEALAVDFLGAVRKTIQDDRFAVAEAVVTKIEGGTLSAELKGEPYDPARHEISVEIKAVTYHQLKIAREGERWVGRVILDL